MLVVMAARVSEEDVMRKRLAVEGDGGGDDRRAMSLLKTFARWSSSSLSGEESEATYQKMLFTLGQCEFSFLKTAAVMEMNQKEMERYEHVYSDIEAKLESAGGQIVELKEELQKSRVIRKHRQEYDALARVITQHPNRQQSKERLVELQSRLADLTAQRKGLEEKVATRKKQFYLLMHSLHLLHQSLSSEEEGSMDTT